MSEIRLVWDNKRDSLVLAPYVEQSGHFLKGPVPLDWLERAADLPGKALTVGLALWFVVGLVGGNRVKLKRKTLDRFKISRQAYHRALVKLSEAGLIVVEQEPGQSPSVTVIAASLGKEDGSP